MTKIEATILTSQSHLAMAIAGITNNQPDKEILVKLAKDLSKFVKEEYKESKQ
jgi:hypothetical protein